MFESQKRMFKLNAFDWISTRHFKFGEPRKMFNTLFGCLTSFLDIEHLGFFRAVINYQKMSRFRILSGFSYGKPLNPDVPRLARHNSRAPALLYTKTLNKTWNCRWNKKIIPQFRISWKRASKFGEQKTINIDDSPGFCASTPPKFVKHSLKHHMFSLQLCIS